MEAIENFQDICKEADGIMIARARSRVAVSIYSALAENDDSGM